MAFYKGKRTGLKAQLEGYQKLDKENIFYPIRIDNVVKGMSEENGLFVYVTGDYEGEKVFVSIPAASLDDFKDITADDLEQIREEGLHLYIESNTSKKGRLYYTAYIDD